MSKFVKRFEELVRNEVKLLASIDELLEEKSKLRDELIDVKGDLSYKREQYDLLEARLQTLSLKFNELDKSYQEKIKTLQQKIKEPEKDLDLETFIQVSDNDLVHDHKQDYYDYWNDLYDHSHPTFGERF